VPLIPTDEHEEAFFRGDKIALLKGQIAHCPLQGFDFLLIWRQPHRAPVARRCNEVLRTSARIVNPLLPLLARTLRKIIRLLSRDNALAPLQDRKQRAGPQFERPSRDFFRSLFGPI
jgi:hypothetical protein